MTDEMRCLTVKGNVAFLAPEFDLKAYISIFAFSASGLR